MTVLGAGVAGLLVAYELERLGFRVEVLEGSGRLGGRVHSYRFGDRPGAPVAELGAMRIPVAHRRVLDCVQELGLGETLEPFRGLTSVGAAAGGTSGCRVGTSATFELYLDELGAEHSRRGYRLEALMVAAQLMVLVDAVAPRPARAQLRHDLRDQLLGLLDVVDLRPHRLAGAGFDLHRVFGAEPQLRQGCTGELGSFLDDVLTETSDGLLRIRDGIGRLVDRLAARISAPILTGHEIVGLYTRPDEVIMEVRHHGRTRIRRSRYAVCTLPFPVVQGLRLTGLSHDKLEVIRSVRYAPATKVALHCREAFWHQGGMVEGAIGSGGVLRQTYYPAADGDLRRGAVLLASYAIGEDAEVLDRMPAPVRAASVIAEHATIHPELRQPGMVRGAASVAWGRHRWSQGGCAVRWGKNAAEAADEAERAGRPEQSLYFAGEHTSSTPAWIEGALESAHTCLIQLTSRIHVPAQQAMAV